MKRSRFILRLKRAISFGLLFLGVAVLLVSSNVTFDRSVASLSNFTRWDEFNFVSWVASALVDKIASASLGLEHYISDEQQSEIVLTYLGQLEKVQTLENYLEELNFAPESGGANEEQQESYEEFLAESVRMHQYRRIAEQILQNQTERALVGMGFGVGGQILPPLLFEVTDLPLNLIVSARDQIGTLKSVSLEAGMDALEKERLENAIFQELNLSALVEPVGGIGAYPTMVMRSTSINWLTEVIAHEWIHNYLSFFPLGVRYFQDDQLRSMNETTANLAGIEVGRWVMIRFYPAYKQLYYQPGRDPTTVRPDGFGERFDYRKQMRESRMVADYLLSISEIEAAERYMEERREFFWQNGYHIRKINQAYFAFYGSYNDTPGGGAAGDDPVGPAVQHLRRQSSRLKTFIDEIKRIKSFDELLLNLDGWK